MSLLGGKSRSAIGLDIDGAFVAAVDAAPDRVRRAVSADLPPGLVQDGEVEDVQGLGAFLKQFMKANNLPKTVRLGVVNQQIAVRSMEVPNIEDEGELAAAVRFQASEAIAMPLDEAVLDYQVVGESSTSDGASLLRVTVVAAREPMIMRLVEAVRMAGMRPDRIDLSAFALVRTLAPLGTTADTPATVYCHLAGVTNLAVAVGADCLFTRPLATIWDGGSADFAAALAEEIRLSIDYYMGQPDARHVGDVVLSGPGSRRGELAEQVAGLVGHPVAIAPPLGRLGPEGIPPEEDPTRFTVAAGLALS
jgi:type IV pilus assembly protein PilM